LCNKKERKIAKSDEKWKENFEENSNEINFNRIQVTLSVFLTAKKHWKKENKNFLFFRF
jgi:hypothetical protein